MRATSPDGTFEFRVLERSGKILAQVYRNSSHSFDTTGKADSNPDWEFASVDEAKEFAPLGEISPPPVPHHVRMHIAEICPKFILGEPSLVHCVASLT